MCVKINLVDTETTALNINNIELVPKKLSLTYMGSNLKNEILPIFQDITGWKIESCN